jgi:hypothetical protein
LPAPKAGRTFYTRDIADKTLWETQSR